MKLSIAPWERGCPHSMF